VVNAVPHYELNAICRKSIAVPRIDPQRHLRNPSTGGIFAIWHTFLAGAEKRRGSALSSLEWRSSASTPSRKRLHSNLGGHRIAENTIAARGRA
jgi:hypothetical protein